MPVVIWLVLSMIAAEAANMSFKLAVTQVQFAPTGASDLFPQLWRLVREPWLIFGMFCYWTSFVLWMVVLPKYRYSDVNLYFSAHYILMLVVAVVVFKEQLTFTRCLGAALIIAGITLVVGAKTTG